MMEGGLAEIATIRTEDGRRSIRIGKTRLLDIVGEGEDMVVECKGGRQDRVRAKPEDLIAQLTRMAHFLEACCEQGDSFQEKSGELYASYRAFSLRTNDFCRSTTEFYTELEQRGFTRRKLRSGMFVQGLKLSQAESDF